MKKKRLVVFVHGWSVTNTNTYGELPRRLGAEARALGMDITVKEIFLGRYVSFRDEVRLSDVSGAFEAAVKRELSERVKQDGRFVCITHSTGGPVVRDWWNRYYLHRSRSGPCPMSHLASAVPNDP